MIKTPNKDQVTSYLNAYGMAPIRRLGQNFLIDDDTARKIVAFLNITEDDIVAEIGPGFGALTAHLCNRQGRLDLYEIDAKMCQFLNDHYGHLGHVTIHHVDVMKADFSQYTMIASNLPYYLTTAIIEKIYRETPNIKQAVFMIQKDVLPRISALVGQDGYGPLAITLSYMCDISSLFDVKPSYFYPVPPVDSLVIGLNFKQPIDWDFARNLDRIVRHIFKNRRKTILNNLAGLVSNKEDAKQLLFALGIDSKQRPENIDLAHYIELVKALIAKRVV